MPKLFDYDHKPGETLHYDWGLQAIIIRHPDRQPAVLFRGSPVLFRLKVARNG